MGSGAAISQAVVTVRRGCIFVIFVLKSNLYIKKIIAIDILGRPD